LKDGGATNTISNVQHIVGTANSDTITGDTNNNILDGGAGNDTILGVAGTNTLYGGAGNDLITGGTAVDTIYGGDGDDTIFSSTGNDTIYGGNGLDTMDFSGRSGTKVFVNLAQNQAQVDTNSNGEFDLDDERDVLYGISRVVGSTGNDTLYGDNLDNILEGNAGINSLYGAGGNDTLIGGTGTDIAYYTPAGSSIYVDMNQEYQVVRDGDGGSDKLTNIDYIYGSDYGDTFLGNGDNNTFLGSVGNDTFYSSTGTNVHNGGADNDLFIITSSTHGEDTLIGGLGNDTVDFSGVIDLGGSTKGLVVTLNGNETVQATLSDANTLSHKLTGVENITGTIYNDTISGDHNNNILRGFAGNNTLIGGAGDDTLIGGTGTDVASYETSGAGINVDMTGVNYQVLDDGLGGRDKLDGIDTIIGSDYADTFKGSTGSDTFIGGSGDDWFIGSAGNDYFEGGTTSSDTVDYSAAITNLVVDINDGSKYINAYYGTDTFVNINGIVGGSGDDTLIGNSGRNTLVGGSGNDTLLGFGGDDYIDGGSGSDFVSFAYTAKNIKLDLAITDAQDTNDGILTIKSIENIAGGAGDDTIYGNSDSNILSGGYGNDTLSGRGGNNILNGGMNGYELTLGAIINGTTYSFEIDGETISYTANGTDTKATVLKELEDAFKGNVNITNSYIVNDGEKLYLETNDTLGAISAITSVTESFIDIADYSINPYNGIKVNLSLASGQVYDNGNGGSDTLIGIEEIRGSNYADTFVGSNGADTIRGGTGNDTFTGGSGNDTFYGEAGDDLFISSYNDGDNTYYGGTTDEINGDTIDYSGITNSEYKVVGDLSNSNISVYNSLDVLQKTDTIYNIENLTGGAGNDTLRGNTSKNTLKGGAGNDTLYVSEGGDRLFGEAGDDTFIFENGIDGSGAVIDGGTTSQTNGDTIDYSELTDGVALRLMGTSYSGVTVGVSANHHTIRNINNIIGSQGDDVIEGDSTNNILDGHLGNNTISFENSGAKVVVNIGDEVTIGGITYNANQATGSTIGTDTITNFQNIIGGSGDDTLIGNSSPNIIYGGIGQDFIFGGDGDDKLYGEDGNDIISGGKGNDTIDGGEGNDTVTYIDASSVIVTLRGATYGSGYVTYGAENFTDRLYSIENVIGSDGNDTIQGNEADNTLDGGLGNNTVSYSGAASGVSVDLSLQGTNQNTLGDGIDYLLNFQNLIGSSHNDILKGDSNTNIISGGAGDDTIYGVGGSNYLYGGTGNDTIYGKVSGSDFIDGGTGNNKVDYSNLGSANFIEVDLSQTISINDENGDSQTLSSITVTGGGIDYIKNINVVEGSQGDDIITGNSGNNTLIGGAGNDTLNGYGGSNVLIGGTNTAGGDWADYRTRNQIKLDLSSGLATVDSDGSGNFEPTDEIDTLIGIENIYGSNLDTYSDDTIVGNDFNNTIFGLKGDDTIDGGRGNNYLDGGDGSDTLSFASVTGVNGIKVNIGDSDITIGSDTISANSAYRNANVSEVYNFENIQGSQNADILIGSNDSNEIYGGAGNDTIYGGEGNNYLFGEAGADRFIMGGFFGSGNDYINRC
jgi:Ca2+-binding RTX toxin-like protein